MSKQIGVLHRSITIAASAAFVLTWSSGFLIAKVGTVDVPVLTSLVWRFAPLAVLLIVLAVVRGAHREVGRGDLGRQALIGLFAQLGYCVCVWASVAVGITSGTTALIDAVQPLVVATLVGPMLGLRVRGAQWAGLGVGAVGVLLVVGSQLGGSDAPAVAYLLPAAAMACLVAGTFLAHGATAQLPVLTTLTVHVTVTAAALLVIAALTGTLVPPSSATFWASVLYAAVFPTLAAYGLYWWLLRRIGNTALNALLYLVAPTTALAGTLMFAEPFTLLTLAGFALCAAGVGVVLTSEARAAVRPVAHPREMSVR
jgi:drug/metabolite transporter (DMT)-like permease